MNFFFLSLSSLLKLNCKPAKEFLIYISWIFKAILITAYNLCSFSLTIKRLNCQRSLLMREYDCGTDLPDKTRCSYSFHRSIVLNSVDLTIASFSQQRNAFVPNLTFVPAQLYNNLYTKRCETNNEKYTRTCVNKFFCDLFTRYEKFNRNM